MEKKNFESDGGRFETFSLEFGFQDNRTLNTIHSRVWQLVIPIRFSGEWTFYISVKKKKTTVRNIELFTNHKGVVVSIDSCIYNY